MTFTFFINKNLRYNSRVIFLIIKETINYYIMYICENYKKICGGCDFFFFFGGGGGGGELWPTLVRPNFASGPSPYAHVPLNSHL